MIFFSIVTGIVKLVRHQKEGWIGTCRQVEPLSTIGARAGDVFKSDVNRLSPELFDNNKNTQKEFNNGFKAKTFLILHNFSFAASSFRKFICFQRFRALQSVEEISLKRQSLVTALKVNSLMQMGSWDIMSRRCSPGEVTGLSFLTFLVTKRKLRKAKLNEMIPQYQGCQKLFATKDKKAFIRASRSRRVVKLSSVAKQLHTSISDVSYEPFATLRHVKYSEWQSFCFWRLTTQLQIRPLEISMTQRPDEPKLKFWNLKGILLNDLSRGTFRNNV